MDIWRWMWGERREDEMRTRRREGKLKMLEFTKNGNFCRGVIHRSHHHPCSKEKGGAAPLRASAEGWISNSTSPSYGVGGTRLFEKKNKNKPICAPLSNDRIHEAYNQCCELGRSVIHTLASLRDILSLLFWLRLNQGDERNDSRGVVKNGVQKLERTARWRRRPDNATGGVPCIFGIGVGGCWMWKKSFFPKISRKDCSLV